MPFRSAQGGEPTRGPGVGVEGVRVPDMGGEELDDAALGVGIGRQQRLEPSLVDPLHRQYGSGVADSRQVFRRISTHIL